MKNLLIVGLLVFGFAGTVFALPITRSEQNVNPFITSTYWLGTTTPSTLSWKGLIVDQICLAGDCQTAWPAGGSGTFSWTPTSWGNSTSTILGFPGFISTASSTFSYLGSGLVGTNNGRLYNSVATSSLAVGASITSSGTLGAQVGGTASSLSLNMANANTWTALQTFGNASTTQLGSTGSAYFATAGGNVGIGTTGPNNKLEIVGAGDADPLNINKGSGTGGIRFTFNGTEYVSYIRTFESGTLADNYMAFGLSTGAATNAEIMKFKGNGNVGIGTTDPWDKLTVHGGDLSVTGGDIRLGTGSATTTLTTSATAFAITANATTTLGTTGLAIGTSQFVVQQTSGKVGIGTTGPPEKPTLY